MASLLALSLLWMLPASHPQRCHSLAWTPSPATAARALPRSSSGATTRARRRRSTHRAPRWAAPPRSLLLLSASSSPVAVVAPSESATKESLARLTVPELKERLRSMGRKVTGNKAELIERLLVHQQSSGDDDTSTNTINEIETDIKSNDLHPSLTQLPDPLIDAMMRHAASSAPPSSIAAASPKLLPIQQKSYEIVSSGGDAVLFSPTGTGKTLAYVLPLAARLYGWKHDGVSFQHRKLAQKARFRRQGRGNGNDSLASSSRPVDAAAPCVLVVEPSRELARQVGKVWTKFHPTATKRGGRQVATVFGGVPMTRHAALLSGKTDVVVGTPGRIRELIREKYLSTEHLRSIVLDEADTLLNFKDNPEVEWLLDGMQNDYQLVLASATINKRVEKFVGEVMELEVGEEGYVVVDAGDYDDVAGVAIGDDDGAGVGIDGLSTSEDGVQVVDSEPVEDGANAHAAAPSNKKPVVNHWSMAASAASRNALAADLVVTTAPRRGIVFVPSKAEVEATARELSERLAAAGDVSVHVLHGDMAQAARSRTVVAFRGEESQSQQQSSASTTTGGVTRVLVATDVASRGLDLPAVDLVLQYGVPRQSGKDGTYDPELYVHRAGRAGRYGNARDSADAILLYDRSKGEGATLPKLKQDMREEWGGVEIRERELPSPDEVMEASYGRAFRRCEEFGKRGGEGKTKLVRYFLDRLSEELDDCDDEEEGAGADGNESILMHRLATAMAALSGLEEAVPPRSLLTSNPKDRTIRVVRRKDDESNSSLTPPEVTKVVKSLGSGKLGRISICGDGSAVFDLGAKKAELLLKNVEEAANDDDANSEISGWHFEMPSSISTMQI